MAGSASILITLLFVLLLELEVITLEYQRQHFHLAETLIITLFALGFSVAVYIATRNLTSPQAHQTIDGITDRLLITTQYAAVLFDALVIVSLCYAFSGLTARRAAITCSFRIFLAFLDVFQVNLQTFIIMDTFAREGICWQYHRARKWVQSLLLCGLLVANICLWLILSFQVG